MTAADQIGDLLSDLRTITDISRAGVLSRREEQLRPGEIRPAAILYLDVAGFTSLARKLTSEQLTQLIDGTFRIFELTVRGFGGYCDKVIGDAGLYVFAGHPDHPPVCEAALRAALKLQERVRQVNESLSETGLTLGIRIGVSFGDVTRQAVGAAAAQVTVMGDTVNTAQRLESGSEPGTVSTTVRVLQKAGDIFESEELGPLELKGIGPVQIHRVTGVMERPVELRGAFRRLTPLTGRDDALSEGATRVRDWLKTAYGPESWDIAQISRPLEGRNRLLLIGGVAAVGKSRLAYELVEGLRKQDGVISTTGHCSESASLGSLTAELARIAGVDAETLPERWDELCAHAGDKVGPEYAERQRELLPVLAHVLGCRHVDTSGIRQADAASFEQSCKLALRACCELAAHFTNQPVVLVIEDLQWLGELQGVVTDLLTRAALPAPLVVIATARPEYEHEAGSLGEGGCYTLSLLQLAAEHGDQIMQALLPGLELPPALTAELHEKAQGIPYYYEEFARMLVRRGHVREEDAGCVLTSSLADLDMPTDIRTLILGRLDQLEADLKALAQRASVLGRSFQCALLTTIERSLGFTGDDHPERPLEQLTQSKVLAREAGDEYFFEHLLLRDAAYASLLKHNRRLLHRTVAAVLEGLLVPGSADEWQLLPQLIRHHEASANYARAYRHACALLSLMAATGSDDDWARAFDHAQTLRRAVLNQPGVDPPSTAPLDLAVARRQVLRGELDAAEQLLTGLLGASEQPGDRKTQTAVLLQLGGMHWYRGEYDLADGFYSRALSSAEKDKDSGLAASALSGRGIVCSQRGDYDEAQRCFQRALRICDSAGNLRAKARNMNNLAGVWLSQGRSVEATALLEEALTLHKSTGAPLTAGLTLANLGRVRRDQGSLTEARDLLRQGLAILRSVGARLEAAHTLIDIGMLSAELRDWETALGELEASAAQIEVHGNPRLESYCRCKQALAYVGLASALAAGELASAPSGSGLEPDAGALGARAAFGRARDLMECAEQKAAKLECEPQLADLLTFARRTIGEFAAKHGMAFGAAD